MPDLSISLLGSFAASLDGRSLLPFRAKSVQALLIYLVCGLVLSSNPQLFPIVSDFFFFFETWQ